MHYSLGGLLIILVVIHLIALHSFSSSNSIINSNASIILPFHCYFFKDLSYLTTLFLAFSIFNYISYHSLSNCDNNIEADILKTPQSILPE